MAVEREVRYRCDLCGEYVEKEHVQVMRVGRLDDRPEDCDRLDIGPECEGRPVRDAFRRGVRMRNGD
jgi:hypothetical protein